MIIINPPKMTEYIYISFSLFFHFWFWCSRVFIHFGHTQIMRKVSPDLRLSQRWPARILPD